MARCEDYPCCGHEQGCCPDFDDAGHQLNMVCTCGAKLPLNNRYSICDACLNAGDDNEDMDDNWRHEHFDEDFERDDDLDDLDDENPRGLDADHEWDNIDY